MILYENGYIKLDLDASTNILYAPCPDIRELDLLHIHKAFSTVVKVVADHNVQKLLLDASQSHIDASIEDHQIVIEQFTRDLMKTKLQKLARIISTNTEQEDTMEQFLVDVIGKMPLTFVIRNFKNIPEAENWLIES